MPTQYGSSSLHSIVIGAKNYGEADVIVTLYTKEKGKVVAIAKGARKLTSKKRSALLLFCKVNCEVIETKGMGIIREAKLVTSFEEFRTDLRKVSLAYFFCEVTRKITPENVPQAEIYILLSKALTRLSQTSKLKFLKNAFTKHILEYSGYSVENGIEPLLVLSQVIERELGSVRVGRMIQ